MVGSFAGTSVEVLLVRGDRGGVVARGPGRLGELELDGRILRRHRRDLLVRRDGARGGLLGLGQSGLHVRRVEGRHCVRDRIRVERPSAEVDRLEHGSARREERRAELRRSGSRSVPRRSARGTGRRARGARPCPSASGRRSPRAPRSPRPSSAVPARRWRARGTPAGPPGSRSRFSRALSSEGTPESPTRPAGRRRNRRRRRRRRTRRSRGRRRAPGRGRPTSRCGEAWGRTWCPRSRRRRDV